MPIAPARRLALALALTALTPAAAYAQTAPGAPGSNQTIPEKDRTLSDQKPTSEQPTLSEKLNKSDGVIAPPGNVDPQMRQTPPPTGGTMPVIPPSAVNPDQPPGAPKPEPK
jgi:hypothetical protein